MDASLVLSDVIHATKYARYIPDLRRRETYHETVDRVCEMHAARFPDHADAIREAFALVHQRLVLPSMRSMQLAGEPIHRNHARIYNCSAVAIDHVRVFAEIPFLLLSGCGVGISVIPEYVSKLGTVRGAHGTTLYIVQDTIEGWAEAIGYEVQSHLQGLPLATYDYSRVRAKGEPLKVTGGKAPGPEPLRRSIEAIRALLIAHKGQSVTDVLATDIVCHASSCVQAGGIRRSALMTLFDPTSEGMLAYKSGDWWVSNPQRAFTNISALLVRGETTREQYDRVMRACEESRAGEPGIRWTNNRMWLTNPCGEVALHSMQFCNLTTVAVGQVRTPEQFLAACRAAAIIGTLQATYTDFHFLRPEWRRNTEREALLGVSITGIADSTLLTEDLKREGARVAVEANREWAKMLGINAAARVTLGKPDGTSSLVAMSASGIHARHSPYYLRTVRFGVDESIVPFLRANLPQWAIEPNASNPEQVVVYFPVRSPNGARTRHDETAVSMAQRTVEHCRAWIDPGHNYGDDKHNQSVTISVRDDEWAALGEYLWETRDAYQGMALLPYDGGTYTQAPHIEIDHAEFFTRMDDYPQWLDLSQCHEDEDGTALLAAVACAGGACELV